jgi:hypothetical protein
MRESMIRLDFVARHLVRGVSKRWIREYRGFKYSNWDFVENTELVILLIMAKAILARVKKSSTRTFLPQLCIRHAVGANFIVWEVWVVV